MTDTAAPAGPAYRVVVNDEDQFSIWPAHKENPAGWHDAGKTAGKEECLAWIEEVWTDMRPRSAREPEAAPLVRLIAEVLETDPGELGDDAGPGRAAGWTSLKHIQLVTSLEHTFGIKLSAADIRGLTSVAAIRETLRAKGADA
ncbi:MbtH family NRPS accessory protein [Amycolatopsis lexingtonensis]|uniref:MbtH family NRPS accessory protein n=1 Tax=Amycolatopsis lexingtonensis TaxID=218822 RepID=UPI003F7159F8